MPAGAGDDTINALRAALRASPDNIPLRQHLAETLLSFGRLDEAEQLYRETLGLAPASRELKLGLARTYLRQGRATHALVIVEAMVKAGDADAAVRLVYARALLKDGDAGRAADQYRAALRLDPAAADPVLAEELGIDTRAEHRGEPLHACGVDHTGDEEADEPDVRTARRGGVELERPRITFADVGGMDLIKDEIRMKIIHPLTHADLYKAYGKSAGGGILMYGPPGCGKTHLARATAGEVKARFLAIGISDVLNMWLGESERNLHALFEQARSNTPCVLFFDEVDALGASRADLRHSAGRQLVNQFLSELDGVGASNDGVLILAATNAPWHIDSAFRRPGRFDRILFVPPPDEPARAAMARLMLAGKPVADLDAESIARRTDGFSGADLKAMVDLAIEEKLRESMRSGGVPVPLSTKDLLGAAKRLKPSTRDWFATAKNHALYSNQSGLYDDVLEYLRLK